MSILLVSTVKNFIYKGGITVRTLDAIVLTLVIIGAINWGLIGFFNLVFGELDEEEKGLIEEKIIQTYEKKNINFDDKSLYKNNENKKIFKETIDMPILEDFYNILGVSRNANSFLYEIFSTETI